MYSGVLGTRDFQIHIQGRCVGSVPAEKTPLISKSAQTSGGGVQSFRREVQLCACPRLRDSPSPGAGLPHWLPSGKGHRHPQPKHVVRANSPGPSLRHSDLGPSALGCGHGPWSGPFIYGGAPQNQNLFIKNRVFNLTYLNPIPLQVLSFDAIHLSRCFSHG